MPALLTTPRLERAARLLWGLVLLTLPVTSFRYMPDFMGRTLIQPLAFYPLAPLIPLLLVLFWRQRRLPLPGNISLLLAFLLFALIASLAGILYAPIPLRVATYDDRVLRAWFSLLVGLAFFFAAFWMNRSERDIKASLKWIYAGLALTILWSLVQALALNTSLIPRSLINQIQTLFSARPLLPRRISGFAYEPSWLADQFIIFFLPWVFAALLARRPLLRQKWVEPLLVLFSLGVLVFTYSRSGLLSALLCIALVFILTGRDLMRRAWTWLLQPFRRRKLALTSGLLLRFGLFAVLVAGLLATAGFLARYDYFARLWDVGEGESAVDYLVDISAGQRLAYMQAGFAVYEGAPLTGAGLGAASLSLFPNYPDWAFVIPEVARQLSPDSNLIPNVKSLYVRLLAETGLPGFWFFVVFFLSFLAFIRRMVISGDAFLRFVAVAGLFAWLGIAIRNLTQDSFTFPIMWIALGMLAGPASGLLKNHSPWRKFNETDTLAPRRARPARRRPRL
ncbi:MAG: O-antigen ligase family protein [Anaerolineales bacterium]